MHEYDLSHIFVVVFCVGGGVLLNELIRFIGGICFFLFSFFAPVSVRMDSCGMLWRKYRRRLSKCTDLWVQRVS